VRLDPIRVPVVTEDFFLLLDERLQEGERHLRRAGFLHGAVAILLGLAQRLVHAQGNPGMTVEHIFPDDDHMHDGIDARLLEIRDLKLAIVRQQPPHLWRAAPEARRIVSGDETIDLAALQHVAQLAAGGRLLDADIRGQRHPGPIDSALHPFDGARRHAVFVLEHGAGMDGGGLTVFRNAGPAADEVLRRFNSLAGVDEDIAVTKHPRRKHRDGNELAVIAARRHQIIRHRHFRNVELPVLQHPPEYLRRLHGQIGKVYAGRPDSALTQRLHSVVGSGSKRQRDVRHAHVSFAIDFIDVIGRSGLRLTMLRGFEGFFQQGARVFAEGNSTFYWILMPSVRINAPYFSYSLFIWAANSSGVDR